MSRSHDYASIVHRLHSALRREPHPTDPSAPRPLRGMGVRPATDVAAGVLEAWAEVLHVLHFYRDRQREEGGLDTAQQPRSIRELLRLTGATTTPALAATTHLAFTVRAPSGPVHVPAGTRVARAGPAGAHTPPAVFETVTGLDTHAEWNQIALHAPVVAANGLHLRATGSPSEQAAGTAALARHLTPDTTLALTSPDGMADAVVDVHTTDRGPVAVFAAAQTVPPDATLWQLKASSPLAGHDAPPFAGLPLSAKLAAWGAAPRGGLWIQANGSHPTPLPAGIPREGKTLVQPTALAVGTGGRVFLGTEAHGVWVLDAPLTATAEWRRGATRVAKTSITAMSWLPSSHSDAGVLAVGTASAGVFVSEDGGATFREARGPRGTAGPPQVDVVEVPARAAHEGASGTPTSVVLGDGGFVQITVLSGSWRPSSAGPLHGAAGTSSPTDATYLKPDAAAFSLVGWFGDGDAPTHPQEVSAIGSGATLAAPHGGGRLVLGMNDIRGTMSDNEGTLQVLVRSGGAARTLPIGRVTAVALTAEAGNPVPVLRATVSSGGGDIQLSSRDLGQHWQGDPIAAPPPAPREGDFPLSVQFAEGTVLAGPVTGVLDTTAGLTEATQWPGHALVGNHLWLAARTKKVAVGHPIVLHDVSSGTRAVRTVTEVRYEDGSQPGLDAQTFGQKCTFTVLRLATPLPEGLDRRHTRVHHDAKALDVQLPAGAPSTLPATPTPAAPPTAALLARPIPGAPPPPPRPRCRHWPALRHRHDDLADRDGGPVHHRGWPDHPHPRRSRSAGYLEQ